MDDTLQPRIIWAWENISDFYQKSARISTRDVHYGFLAYGEKKLNLLGDVRGKRVLEIGCGGGQNTIALTRWGAEAFGVDPTQNQIRHARQLAHKCGINAVFAVAAAEELPFQNTYFDVVISSYAWGYVADIEKAYEEVYRVLKEDGFFVFCQTHPYFSAVGYYLAEDPEEPEIRDYLSWPGVTSWEWVCDEESIEMWGYLRTLSQVINPLLDRKFILERIIEQG